MPSSTETYVHQCDVALDGGYGRPGAVITIVSSEPDIDALRRIENYYGIRMVPLPQDLTSVA